MEVKVNNIYFSYDSNKMIDNFSCFIKDNMISAIVGRNGSGKSTLAGLIDGVFSSTNGYIKIGNIMSSRSVSYRKSVGILFQLSSSQVFSSSVYLEIKHVLDYFKCIDVDKKIRDSIKLVGLSESILSRRLSSLSSSELRKVCLASVLSYNPDVLVLDEPFAGLDYKSRCDLLRFLRNLKKKYGKTIIIVSSDTDFVHKIADYVFLINDGAVYLEGDKYDVLSNEIAMSHCGLKVPDVLHFSNLVLKNKNIKIGYRDEINDLIKDVYRYVK